MKKILVFATMACTVLSCSNNNQDPHVKPGNGVSVDTSDNKNNSQNTTPMGGNQQSAGQSGSGTESQSDTASRDHAGHGGR